MYTGKSRLDNTVSITWKTFKDQEKWFSLMSSGDDHPVWMQNMKLDPKDNDRETMTQNSSLDDPVPVKHPWDGRREGTGSSCSRFAVSDNSGGRWSFWNQTHSCYFIYANICCCLKKTCKCKRSNLHHFISQKPRIQMYCQQCWIWHALLIITMKHLHHKKSHAFCYHTCTQGEWVYHL